MNQIQCKQCIINKYRYISSLDIYNRKLIRVYNLNS